DGSTQYADHHEIAPLIASADLGSELPYPALELLGPDQDLSDRGVVHRLRLPRDQSRTRALRIATSRAPGSSRKSSETATPATHTTRPAAVTTGRRWRSDRGTPRSVNTSWRLLVPSMPR